MAIRQVSWKTRKGRRRIIRLYMAWRNLGNRIRGNAKDGSGVARWKGLENGFRDWKHFRSWALAAGYSKDLVLDRKDELQGYTPDNCQWITKRENAEKANMVHKEDCPCWACHGRRRNAEAFLCEHGRMNCKECD